MRPAGGILVIAATCGLLPACVAVPYGYPYPVTPPPVSYGPAGGYQRYALPPPVPPAVAPEPRGYDAPPGYRPYDPAPAYRPGDGRLGGAPDDGRPGGAGYNGPGYDRPGYDGPGYGGRADGRERWDPGFGQAPAPGYRPPDGPPSGQPRRNRLDDPEPEDPPETGASGLGQPNWR